MQSHNFAMNLMSLGIDGGTQHWLNVVFLVGVLVILAFRGQQIAAPRQFLIGCGLFAGSLVLPSLGGIIALPMIQEHEFQLAVLVAARLFGLVALAMFVAGFLMVVLSMLPTRSEKSR